LQSRKREARFRRLRLVDRSGGKADLGVPYPPLIRIDVPTYKADALPAELASIPAVKPGSRAAA
jgi:orotate phosphoribosyltransferase